MWRSEWRICMYILGFKLLWNPRKSSNFVALFWTLEGLAPNSPVPQVLHNCWTQVQTESGYCQGTRRIGGYLTVCDQVTYTSVLSGLFWLIEQRMKKTRGCIFRNSNRKLRTSLWFTLPLVSVRRYAYSRLFKISLDSEVTKMVVVNY